MKKKLLLLAGVLFVVMGYSQAIQKVLIEEHTGAWCGYCPDGALILDDIIMNHNSVIPVSIHNSDAMYGSTQQLIQNFYGPAYPQATFNRNGAPISRNLWESETIAQESGTPIFSVSFDNVLYHPSTNTIDVTIRATALSDASGAFRFNVYLTEDSVTGSGSGYDQVSYYNTQSGHPLFGLGNPIVGYVHNNVFRQALGGAWGQVSSMPSNVTAGQQITYTWTGKPILSATYNIWNMHIIGMVVAYNGTGLNQRPIYNSETIPFSTAVGLQENASLDTDAMEIYPNPVSSTATIGYNLAEMGAIRIEVLNMAGQQIRILQEGFNNAGMHTAYWDGTDLKGNSVANGLYVVRLTTEKGQSLTKKIILER